MLKYLRMDMYRLVKGKMLWVTLGNTLSGAVFMGLGYWYATPKANRPVADKFNQTETAAG